MSSPGASKSIRRTATVTISAPEAATASRMVSNESYFPVPRMRRERKLRPAITSSSFTATPFAGMTQIRFFGRGLVAASQPPSRGSRVALKATNRPSAAGEARLTLLDERRHAFLLVLGRERHREEVRFGAQVVT